MWIPRGTVDLSRATATPLVRFSFLDPTPYTLHLVMGWTCVGVMVQSSVEPSVPTWGQGSEGSRHGEIVQG